MSYIIICTVALLVSGLTLFSGFGLGTLLMPAFALFFPVEVAIAATAIVHLANNLFKIGLVGRKANPMVVLKFALPAAITAVVVDVSRLMVYGATFFSRDFATLKDQGGIGLVIAGSLAAFAGAFIASRFLKKITMRTIQMVVGAMLFLLSIAIGTGMI
ncbi:MAG: hypothetical protein ACQEQ7_02685 [Thermodesulfobacteriota bacterium]